ncbi:SelR-domain-containing protein [Auriscalpium vulgare]|uniref:SelR-domain-containing protein n=1 Tax=Auriscalpium vulgare TaxID=40419 RepID=A0ACB8RTC3_9AGAM|nr:SelR-domain-containing protein [Auriscalpium vulgare]
MYTASRALYRYKARIPARSYLSLFTPLPSSTILLRAMSDSSRTKSDSEWQAILSPEQFRVLRQKGTERPGTGKYEKTKADGVYTCAACETPLYKSTTKFDSGCGWPAFFDAIPGAVSRHEDSSFGMTRIEITCTACGGHLGHVFKGEGFKNPIDERHCVNSVSLNFVDENGQVDKSS